ncbi:type II secretion system F family protein [Kitasatospora sp. NPDC049285]|uniref:type II secretion system F family protein n=1 Tax=Kitasatospora sp. NPDC049285 TaxID=3157096 RepID=UPI00344A7090
MILTMLTGAACGLGLYLLVRALLPGRPRAATVVARIDALRSTAPAPVAGPLSPRASVVSVHGRLTKLAGPRMSAFFASQGWTPASQRANLALLERSTDAFMAQKLLFSAAGLVVGPLLAAALWLLGVTDSALSPLWLTLLAVLGCFFLPDAEIATEAAKARLEFQRIISVYLTLVHLNLAGGAGLPEALKSSSEVSDAPPMLRIRRALDEARLQRVAYWAAPGRLGEEVNLPDLVDLTSTLRLVAADGARVRDSLKARADTLRKRELARLHSKAGAAGQSMTVAQMLLCFGFLIFLGYPAYSRLVSL